MTKTQHSLLSALLLLTVFIPLQAQSANIDVPGVQIHSDANGSSIVAPGVNIESSSNGSASVVTNTPTTTPTIVMPMAPQVQQPLAPTTSVASYANASLSGMDFSHKNLAGAHFTNATLMGANFAGSNLANADFTNANLDKADFSQAILIGAALTNASLKGATLSGADFSHADLTNASIEGAVIDGARFDGANLTNVDMSRAVHHAEPAVRPAFVDANTIATALKTDPGNLQTPRKIDLTINFDFNSDKLTTDGQRQVQEIAGALRSGPLQNAHILIEGHTDNVGSDNYNKDLSYRRAMRVMRFLVDNDGVPANQLSSQGFGKSHPIASNDNDLGRAMNRRVTLVNLGQSK